MIRLGRVEGNLMTCLQPTNKKLRIVQRVIVAAHLGLSEAEAVVALNVQIGTFGARLWFVETTRRES